MPCETWTEPLEDFIHSGEMWQGAWPYFSHLECFYESSCFVWLVNQLDFFKLVFHAKQWNYDVTPYREDVFGGVMTHSPDTFSRNKLGGISNVSRSRGSPGSDMALASLV